MELLERIQAYWQVLVRYRWRLILISLLSGAALLLLALFSQERFTALTTFHPDIGQSQPAGIPDNPLSLILGNSFEGSEAGLMLGVLRSRNLSERVAADSIIWEGKPALLADLILSHTPKGFNPLDWVISLFTGDKPPPTLRKKVVRSGNIIRKKMEVETTEDGFIEMSLTFFTVELTEHISRNYIAELKTYYTQQKTEKAQRNLRFFTKRADSVKTELDKVARSLASFEDRSRYNMRAQNLVFAAEQQVKLEYLKQMFTTLVVSREQALSQLQKETPVIQVLDWPEPPFVKQQASVVLYTALGIFLGLLLISLFLTRSLWWADLQAFIRSSLESGSKKQESAA